MASKKNVFEENFDFVKMLRPQVQEALMWCVSVYSLYLVAFMFFLCAPPSLIVLQLAFKVVDSGVCASITRACMGHVMFAHTNLYL